MSVALPPPRLQELLDGRLRLATLPTPLHALPRLSEALGREVWVKRDDLTGTALGGNKVRKLELLVAEARRQGADCLVTVGAAQSNHARTTAAVAAIAGMGCHLLLAGRTPDRVTGNLVLDRLLGAELHFAGTHDWVALHAAMEELAEDLRRHGHRPYTMPVGGSVPLGVAGFTAAYVELREQCGARGLRPRTIVHASSSGGTQAGLELGRVLTGDPTRVVGIDVAKITGALRDVVARLVAETAEVLGVDAADADPTVLEGYAGDGYAVESAGAADALRLLARTEGVLTDPVYSAKALHAVVAEPFEEPVVFWHTGGVPALFAEEYEPAGPAPSAKD